LADLLKAADAAAVIDHVLGPGIWTAMDRHKPYATLCERLGERAYLSDILERHANKHALSFDHIVRLMAAAPPQ
jgi:hypothetical protein